MPPGIAKRERIHQFSLAPWPTGSSEGHDGRFSRDPLPVFSAGGRGEQFWHGQGCPLFELDVIHPALRLRPQHHVLSKVPWRMVLEKLLRRVTCRNHASFRLLAVARCSCGPTRKSILFRTQWLVSCSKQEMRRSLLKAFGLEGLDPFLRVSEQGSCFTAIGKTEVVRD